MHMGACGQSRVAPRADEGGTKALVRGCADNYSIHFAARNSCRIRAVSGLIVPSAGAKSFCILTLYRRSNTRRWTTFEESMISFPPLTSS